MGAVVENISVIYQDNIPVQDNIDKALLVDGMVNEAAFRKAVLSAIAEGVMTSAMVAAVYNGALEGRGEDISPDLDEVSYVGQESISPFSEGVALEGFFKGRVQNSISNLSTIFQDISPEKTVESYEAFEGEFQENFPLDELDLDAMRAVLQAIHNEIDLLKDETLLLGVVEHVSASL